MADAPGRWARLRRRWRLILRVSLAAPLAFYLATELLNHTQAFFAPISAILVIVAGTGLRVRALFELIVGVTTGVVAGELLIVAIGRGPWQLGVVVAIALVVATLLGLKGIAFNQAAVSAVLLTVIVPTVGTNPALTRMTDTLLGGAIGLLAVLLIPRRPVRDIDREVQVVLTTLSSVLRKVSVALRTEDPVLADAALVDARSTQPMLTNMAETARNVSEIARLAPARWRQRAQVEVYAAAVPDLANAMRNARVLARKCSALLRHRELVPPGLPPAIDQIIDAYALLADELAVGAGFDRSCGAAVDASQQATHTLPHATSINAATIAGQVRSLAADLMYATGLTREEVDERLGEA